MKDFEIPESIESCEFQMAQKEKLTRLIKESSDGFSCQNCEPSEEKCSVCIPDRMADYLLNNGVIVLPCKPGDFVYWITDDKKIRKNEVFSVRAESEDKHYVFYVKCRVFNQDAMFRTFMVGRTCFLTREEAEIALNKYYAEMGAKVQPVDKMSQLCRMIEEVSK